MVEPAARDSRVPRLTIDDVDDVVVYDVMREALFQLGGILVALEDRAEAVGDATAAAGWSRRSIEVDELARHVDARDRAAQIALYRQFRAEYVRPADQLHR